MKIVFFDGYCSLYNTLVDWLIELDKSAELKFASLQGETAAELLGRSEKPIDLDTVIYLRDDEKFDRSSAVLRILSDIGGIWRFARFFLIVPKFLRDFVYRGFARNRYHFIKKRETCRMPTLNEQSRLLP